VNEREILTGRRPRDGRARRRILPAACGGLELDRAPCSNASRSGSRHSDEGRRQRPLRAL